MTCPICDHDVPLDHAVEWECEPAPNSGKWGMSVCSVCHDGVYGRITPWDWVQTILQRERSQAEDRADFIRRLRAFIELEAP